MSDLVKKEANEMALNMQRVEDKIVVIRNLEVIADADVAALYGVETKRVNEAVRNNPEKFPARYMFELTNSELQDLRSKISSTNVSAMNRNPTKLTPNPSTLFRDYTRASVLEHPRTLNANPITAKH